MDRVNGQRDAALIAQLRTLYRSRPFTKAIPFQVTLPVTSADTVADLWVPNAAYFEAAILVARCNVAGIDINFCDTNAQNPFLFVMLSTTTYQVIDIQPGYRSLQSNGAKLVVTNLLLILGVIKGVWMGWEVTQEGYYR
jgi:hypothetical protein